MTHMTYTKLLNTTLEKYVTSGAEAAYEYISRYAGEMNEDHAQIYNFHYSLAAASGHEEEALTIMKEAILDKGHWYAYDYLIEDDDLNSLRKYEDFQKMVELCKRREEEAKKAAKPKLEIMHPDMEQKESPLLIALHGNQESYKRTKENWQSIVSQGYILGMPQSSEIEFSGGYSWDDVEGGTKELQGHYKEIIEHEAIDKEQIVLGGFSAGARVALNAILKGSIPVKGFIFVGPWLPEIDEVSDELSRLAEMGIKGYVICGDQDEDCLESTERFVELLKEKNIQHTYHLIKGLDHDYPEDFHEILDSAIQFITKGY
ncbi:alpha/beta hydrolase [Pseudalkalibacillus sp. SCS-8]|uniref:alpha/beta hydrolase n=1 Tax=Pseudalkalibacillus nanhaiensis TaxID=3115291 RepID=UPI0032DAD22D